MAALILTRGIPASGKTTWAKEWLAAAPDGERRARSNRDDLRASVFGRDGVLPHDDEETITRIQHAAVRDLLRRGVSVVVDDINLRAKFARVWADLAVECGAELQVQDFTDVPLGEVLRRDADRAAQGGRSVGADAIRAIHAKFLASGRLAPITPTERPAVEAPATYVPDLSLPPAWIVDVDGTLALMNGRGPFEWHRVGEDRLNGPVRLIVEGLCAAGANIIVMSGRDEACRPETEAWLVKHDVPYHELHMRPAGDMRRDAVVKAELFDEHVRHRYAVEGVIDDRDQVVAFWRSLGLMCAQVAPGDF